MKLYVVSCHWDYEGGNIIGIYSDLSMAQEAKEKCKRGDSQEIQEVWLDNPCDVRI